VLCDVGHRSGDYDRLSELYSQSFSGDIAMALMFVACGRERSSWRRGSLQSRKFLKSKVGKFKFAVYVSLASRFVCHIREYFRVVVWLCSRLVRISLNRIRKYFSV
jgi:hypothetical protein